LISKFAIYNNWVIKLFCVAVWTRFTIEKYQIIKSTTTTYYDCLFPPFFLVCPGECGESTDIPHLTQQLHSKRSGARWIFHKSEFSTHVVNYMYVIHMGLYLKSKLQHTRTWPATASQPHGLCDHPAVFFCHLCLTVLSFLQGNIGCPIQKCCYFNFLYSLKIA
jgi:hypothetical protein